MSKSATRKVEPRLIFIYLTILLSLLLTAINISSYLSPVLVLGIETEAKSEEVDTSDQAFWQDFLFRNPEYIPGWVELGRYDKAREIDPNYLF